MNLNIHIYMYVYYAYIYIYIIYIFIYIYIYISRPWCAFQIGKLSTRAEGGNCIAELRIPVE